MELAVLVMVIVFSLVAMQTYLKRGLQGRLRENIDGIGEQYDPVRTTSDITTRQEISSTSSSDTVEEPFVNPVSGTPEGRSVTTSSTVTHYDNSYSSGFESVLGA